MEIEKELRSWAADGVFSMTRNFIDETIDLVNTRMDGMHGAASGEGGKREYATTPGSGRQSLAAYAKAANDWLVDAQRDARKAPGDMNARIALLLATSLYGSIGQHFADIVVDKSAIPDGDPLNRPPLPEKKNGRTRALRGEHLSPGLQDAVLDAASLDPQRAAAGREALEETINSGDVRELGQAAAILGNLDDPINRHKVNGLVTQIEKARWQSDTQDKEASEDQAVAAAPSSPPMSKIRPAVSEIVTAGGENARSIGHKQRPRRGSSSALDFYDKDEFE